MMLLNKETIEKLNFFENLTKAKVKEIIEKEDKNVFIVDEGDLNKALGIKGKNIKMIENLTHKRIRIVEFSKDPLRFIKNFIYPVKPLNIELKDNLIEIKAEDRKSKGLLIGREGKNLEELNNLLKSYYNLQAKVL